MMCYPVGLLMFLFCAVIVPENSVSNTVSTPDKNEETAPPSVLIVLLVRSKAHALPYVLGALEQQTYPRKSVSLYIREDNSVDESALLLESWRAKHLEKGDPMFHSIDLQTTTRALVKSNATNYTIPEWTKERFEHMMTLRQTALDFARQSKMDRVFLLDADVVLTNKNALKHMVQASEEVAVLAPLLNCTGGGSLGLAYSNFWGAMNEKGYYSRSDDYMLIKRREKIGILKVPMVNTAIMINLRHNATEKVRFGIPDAKENYTGPFDDVIIFALRAKQLDLELHLDNRIFFGHFTEPQAGLTLENEQEYFRHLILEAMLEQSDADMLGNDTASNLEIPSTQFLDSNWTQISVKRDFAFDRIFVINLARRSERLQRMKYSFKVLGYDMERVEAVDGNSLNASYLVNLGVRQLPGYVDSFFSRGLNFGEVAKFLSHMQIWQEVAKNPNLHQVIIFEDDIRFFALFDSTLREAAIELVSLKTNWDFLYLGRKILLNSEKMLYGANHLAVPYYSSWSLGYAITKLGAQKLLDQQPLSKLITIDNFLPIMFDQHPQLQWKAHFALRNLTALTTAPLLVEPAYYTGDKFYESDVENSMSLCNLADGSSDLDEFAKKLCGKPIRVKLEL